MSILSPHIAVLLVINVNNDIVSAAYTKNENAINAYAKNRVDMQLKQKEASEPKRQLKAMITRQIEGVDKAIDTAVYKLYNLTEEEINLVEGEG